MAELVVGKKYRFKDGNNQGQSGTRTGDVMILTSSTDRDGFVSVKRESDGKEFVFFANRLAEIDGFQKYVDHEKQLEGLLATRRLHAQAILEDESYENIKTEHNNGACPMCAANKVAGRVICKNCPWVMITGTECSMTNYSDSIKRVQELSEWILLYREDMAREPVKQEVPFTPFAFTIPDEETALLIYAIFNAGSGTEKEIYDSLNKTACFPDDSKRKYPEEYRTTPRYQDYLKQLRKHNKHLKK